MADRNPEVMEFVKQELLKNPDIQNDELQEKAAEIDPSVAELAPRVFNAKYPLQVKRRIDNELTEEERKERMARIKAEAVHKQQMIAVKGVARAEDKADLIRQMELLPNTTENIMYPLGYDQSDIEGWRDWVGGAG